jgi:tight adherence protein C
MNPTVMLLVDLVLFGVITLACVVVATRVQARAGVRRRLRTEAAPGVARPSASLVRRNEVRNPLLAWVQKESLSDPKERQKLRRDLIQAGFESPAAPVWYVVIRFGLAVGLPLAYLFSLRFAAKPPTGLMLILIPLGLSAMAMIIPRAFIDNRAGARRTQIEQDFPDALDMMVVCVEAGLGLEGALVRVGAETVESHPRIAHEFETVSQELRAGRTRAEALRNFADRTQVETVRAFVALLIQTDALGVSIAQSLRTYSAEMRQHRMLKAEEKAMRLPVLLTIPLVLFILPVIVASVMLPAAIEMIRNFLPALAAK